MNQAQLPLLPEDMVKKAFADEGIDIVSIERRDYPEETIFVVRVVEQDLPKSAEIGNRLDHALGAFGCKGFVTVRKADQANRSVGRLKAGVNDPKTMALLNLLTARSRTSEIQPSLRYIPDTARNIDTVVSPRHQLIFGRRGAGKTALMVEAKRVVSEQGHVTVWVNLQTLRLESLDRAFVLISQRVCDAMQAFLVAAGRTPQILATIAKLREELEGLASAPQIVPEYANRLIPRLQQVVRRFLDSCSVRIYIFIDELHYFNRNAQPRLLDMIHGSVRDCEAWLKIAGIKHLCTWFQSHPPLGLQTGHDADHIDLDITLESPSKAKAFLEEVLRSYANTAGINSLSSLALNDALDRLVLASGAVPRDYLVLSAGAIRKAQQRERARVVGVQDVNNSAGEAAKVKITELEDDASSDSGTPSILLALQAIRKFCLDDKRCTFFRIDFRDKEERATEYSLIQDLMDLRLLHLIESSLSDEHEAGRRSEVYMLDLSQFSGQRLKKKLKVLDFVGGHLFLKETGTTIPGRKAVTSKQRQGILRRGPVLDLQSFPASRATVP